MKQNISEHMSSRAEELISSGLDGKAITRKLAGDIDRLLISAFEQQPSVSLSLVAVGGYGRREMFPYSDIDIMLLSKSRDSITTETAQSVLYRLWDMGLNISHCFRTLDECVEDSVADLKTRTSLMESRFLAGSQDVFEEFKRDAYQKILFKRKRELVGNLLAEIDRRHKIYGDSIYLLEPNIKDGIGGLRDIHTLLWLAKVALKINDIAGLTAIMPENDYRNLVKAYDFLLKIRVCLHSISNGRNDVLSFEFQDRVAEMFGFCDTKRFLAEEILMRLYYKKVKNITNALAGIMNISSRKYINFPVNFSVKKITNDFYISKNEVIVKDREIFRDTDKILEAFHIYSVTGKKLSCQVKEGIRSRFLFINKKTRTSGKAITHFLEILKGNRVYKTLREMHDTGILDRFIPEFGRLRHLVLYDAYHRYTVDEHSLIAIKNLELLKETQHLKLQYLADILKGLKQEVLFLAILLHDIGKGGSNRHEEAGYKMLKGIMERFNIEHDDRRTIEFLVKNHILLSKLALTRDIDAPETITQLAEAVENEENLNALYIMTYADMTAVSPHFRTEWKAYLLHDIYAKTKDHIQGVRGGYSSISDKRLRDFVENMPDRYIVSSTNEMIYSDYLLTLSAETDKVAVKVKERPDNTTEIVIATRDMPGLFSKIVGVLSFKGFNILRARIYTGKDGIVIDKILISNWRDMWWQGMEEQIREDLYRSIVLGQGIMPEKKSWKHTLPNRRLESFVEVDNETSDRYTILELLLPDRIGLLFDISTELNLYNSDIVSAVINTEEGIANDVFYLQVNGGKLKADIVLKVLNSIQNSEVWNRE